VRAFMALRFMSTRTHPTRSRLS